MSGHKDLDLVRRRLVIQAGKGGKQRIVYLPDHLVEALRGFCAERSHGPLFPGRDRAVLSLRAINYVVGRVAEAAGLQTPNPRYRQVGRTCSATPLRGTGRSRAGPWRPSGASSDTKV